MLECTVAFVFQLELLTFPSYFRSLDVGDRIRAIAHGLGLRTILWQYDSQD
jgi:hypothetical protein